MIDGLLLSSGKNDWWFIPIFFIVATFLLSLYYYYYDGTFDGKNPRIVKSDVMTEVRNSIPPLMCEFIITLPFCLSIQKKKIIFDAPKTYVWLAFVIMLKITYLLPWYSAVLKCCLFLLIYPEDIL